MASDTMSSGSEYDQSDSDDSVSSVQGIDAHRYDQIEMVLELAEWAARTTQAHSLNGSIGRAVLKQVQDLNFYARRSLSASWKPAFSELVNYAHAARIVKISKGEKCQLREGARLCSEELGAHRYAEGDWNRCVICNTVEHSATWCVDLCCNSTWRTYDSREFMSSPRTWGTLFKRAMKGNKIYNDDWTPDDRLGMPKEFLGSFAVGDTCLSHLVTMLSAQNMPLSFIYSAMAQLHDNDDTNMAPAPSNDTLTKETVTPERVHSWNDQIERIRCAIAHGSGSSMHALLEYDEMLWERVDASIAESLTVTGARGETRHQRCGYWAAQSMHRASMLRRRGTEDESKSPQHDDNRAKKSRYGRPRNRRTAVKHPRHDDDRGDGDKSFEPKQQRRRAVYDSDGKEENSSVPGGRLHRRNRGNVSHRTSPRLRQRFESNPAGTSSSEPTRAGKRPLRAACNSSEEDDSGEGSSKQPKTAGKRPLRVACNSSDEDDSGEEAEAPSFESSSTSMQSMAILRGSSQMNPIVLSDSNEADNQ